MRLSRHDVRLAARSLARHRRFAAIAVFSLALAIALNTTMYSVLDAMVNPKPEIRDPDRLYELRLWGDIKGTVDDRTRAALIRSGLHNYEDVSYYQRRLRQAGGVEYGKRYAQIASATVAPNFFRMLGTRPVAGRVFVDDDYNAETPVAMIGERLAATLSPDQPFPVGSVVDVAGNPTRVIGVISVASLLPRNSGDDLWLLPPPSTPLASLPINIIRVRASASIGEVVAELEVLSSRVAALAGESPKYTRFQISPAADSQFHIVNFHYALIGAVIAVLLIACANLANLQLARGIGRSRELALRAALGASRRDIVVHLVLESVLLAAAGLLLGLVLTFWGVHLLKSRIPPSVADFVIAPQISWRVMIFAAVASVFCTILIGLLPAIHASRVDPNELLKSGAGTGANRKNRRRYGVMVAVEIGLSLAIVSGAAIVVRTALMIQRMQPAFDLRPLTTVYAVIGTSRDTTLRIAAVSNELVNRLRAIPDAKDVGLHITRNFIGDAITTDERQGSPRERNAPSGTYTLVTAGYLRTYGRTIVRGRDFLEGIPSKPEVIVDERTAQLLWPNVDPIGAQIKLGGYKSSAPWVRVVGVVKNMRDPREADRRMYTPVPGPHDIGDIFYLPSANDSIVIRKYGSMLQLLIRARSDPERMPITVARYLQVGGLIRFTQATTLERQMGLITQRQSHAFVAAVFTVFAAMGIGLAALGIYGIVAHSVAERKRELGVRIALGATGGNIVHAVIRDGNPVVLAGVAIGLYCTKESVAWLHAFSFEGDENDALLFAAVAFILFVVAVIAALPPAVRATRIDPVESLRSE